MADGVDEVGAVERVEVELAHAVVDQVHDLLGGDRGRHQACRLGIVVEPLEALAQVSGAVAPVRPAKPATCLKLWIGTMPGVIGAWMPRARALSRKR